MARFLDNETVYRVWKEEGGHMERTSDRLSISKHTIRRHLADMGIHRPSGRPSGGGCRLTDAELLKLHRTLNSITKLHKRTGYSQSWLRRRLRRLGVPPDPRWNPNHSETQEQEREAG